MLTLIRMAVGISPAILARLVAIVGTNSTSTLNIDQAHSLINKNNTAFLQPTLQSYTLYNTSTVYTVQPMVLIHHSLGGGGEEDSSKFIYSYLETLALLGC